MKQLLDYFTPRSVREPSAKWWEYVRDVLVAVLILNLVLLAFLLSCGLVLLAVKGF